MDTPPRYHGDAHPPRKDTLSLVASIAAFLTCLSAFVVVICGFAQVTIEETPKKKYADGTVNTFYVFGGLGVLCCGLVSFITSLLLWMGKSQRKILLAVALLLFILATIVTITVATVGAGCWNVDTKTSSGKTKSTNIKTARSVAFH